MLVEDVGALDKETEKCGLLRSQSIAHGYDPAAFGSDLGAREWWETGM
jgi:hypothetical protein